jgi:hypothetical protein
MYLDYLPLNSPHIRWQTCTLQRLKRRLTLRHSQLPYAVGDVEVSCWITLPALSGFMHALHLMNLVFVTGRGGGRGASRRSSSFVWIVIGWTDY